MTNKENPIFCSVVIPAFRCENTIEILSDRIKNVLKKDFEIIVVNDGGSEKDWAAITKAWEKADFPFTIVRLSRNYGQHNATLCGIAHAKGTVIVTLDDDLQVLPEEIPTLIATREAEGSDLVYGIFPEKKHTFVRNLGSGYIKKTSKILLNSPGEGSSFRLITGNLASHLLQHAQSFVYIDEVLLWYTDNISFVPVEHHKRIHKKSGYSILKLVKITMSLTTHYTAIPLKIITWIGMLSAVFTFLGGLMFLYRKLVNQVPDGFTSIILAILFSSSIILFSLGVLGQYLNILYQSQNKKPSYHIRYLKKK